MDITDLIFDGDDTLWPCGKFYIAQRNEMADYQSTRTGIPADICDKILNDLDLTCIKLPNGFGEERYPRSFAATSVVLDMVRGVDPDMKAATKSYNIGKAVFDAPYYVFEDVMILLRELKKTGLRLYLLTKGPHHVQNRKINMNHLRSIFDEDKIYIVDKKTEVEMRRILRDHNLDVTKTMMVGDSMKDDVGSALAVGMYTTWIGHPDKPQWGYEDKEHRPHHTIQHVSELRQILHSIFVSVHLSI